MINAQDIKNGTCIRMDGKLYFCIEFLHVKPGKGNTFMRTKLKDVVSGYVLERRFNIGEKLEDVRVERRPYQFLYKEGEDYIFMNQETFDQHPIAHDLINGVDAIRFSSLRCRRVFVPVHCGHSGTGGRLGRLIILWNIRPQAKNQIRRNHLSQGCRQGVALGVAFQADSDI